VPAQIESVPTMARRFVGTVLTVQNFWSPPERVKRAQIESVPTMARRFVGTVLTVQNFWSPPEREGLNGNALSTQGDRGLLCVF